MGISHPLSGEFDAPRGGVLSPERTPPSCCSGDQDYLEHVVSRMDTLAGIAIKYGVEISDIKRANSLASDSQMFAHKTLLIPLPGRPMPSSVRLNGSGQRMERAWAPNHQQNRDATDSLDSSKCKSDQQRTSLAMSTLQRYYGLTSQKGDNMDCSTEMSLYSKGSFQRISSETLLASSEAGTLRTQLMVFQQRMVPLGLRAMGQPKQSMMVPCVSGRKRKLIVYQTQQIPRMTFWQTQLRSSRVYCQGQFPVSV